MNKCPTALVLYFQLLDRKPHCPRRVHLPSGVHRRVHVLSHLASVCVVCFFQPAGSRTSTLSSVLRPVGLHVCCFSCFDKDVMSSYVCIPVSFLSNLPDSAFSLTYFWIFKKPHD